MKRNTYMHLKTLEHTMDMDWKPCTVIYSLIFCHTDTDYATHFADHRYFIILALFKYFLYFLSQFWHVYSIWY